MSIWVVEDHRWLRDSVREALERADCGAVECFGSCESALTRLQGKADRPKVILLDLGLPGMSGLDGLRGIKQMSPETEVVVFTVLDDSGSVFDAILGGASGYLLKSEPLERIVTAVREVQRGGSPMTAEVARQVLEHFNRIERCSPRSRDALTPGGVATEELSAREREVLALLASGLAKKQVASRLGLSFHTIDNYVRRIYSKLHVNSLGAAVACAVRKGVI